MLIQGSCKTNPIPGSCCYYEDVKAPQPPQTGAVTGRLVLKKQHKLAVPALAKLPAQPIPKYSVVFFRISSDSWCEHKALWIIIKINQILLPERRYTCSCFTQKSFQEALQLSEGAVSPSSRPLCHSRAARKTRHIHPRCHCVCCVGWLTALLGWTCPREFKQIPCMSQDRNGCDGAQRLNPLLSWKPRQHNTILSFCAISKYCTLKRRTSNIKYVCFYTQVTEYCLSLTMYKKDIMHGSTTWYHAR